MPKPRRPPAADPALPELVWEGKYAPSGRRRQPDLSGRGLALRVVEQVGTVGAWSPEAPGSLVLGDNLAVLSLLLPALRGRVQLISVDPPFAAGEDFLLAPPAASPSAARGLAYRDRWGPGAASYLQQLYERLVPMRELLSASGVLVLHCDWRNQAPVRLLLDEVFGARHFINEIIWHYYNKFSAARHCLPRAHDTLLAYGRTDHPRLNALRLPRPAPVRQLVREAVGGVLRNARDSQGRLRYRVAHDKKADDVWDLPQLQPASPHWSGYPTQKHPLLAARVVGWASAPGDLVADFYCGAGTTLLAAHALGRRWLGCDSGPAALAITRSRLLEAGAAAPGFTVLHVQGERRSWLRRQRLGGGEGDRARLLRLAGAQATPDAAAWPHGHWHGWAVHVAGPEQVLGARHLLELAARARRMGIPRLVCLAWRFEPGLWERAGGISGVTLLPVILPRHWLVPGEPPPVPLRVVPRLQVRQGPGRGNALRSGMAALHLLGWAEPSLPAALEAARLEWPAPSLRPVRSWAVQWGWQPGQPFAPQRWAGPGEAGRGGRSGKLNPRLAAPAPPAGAPWRSALVRAVDGEGLEAFARMTGGAS